jgi:hypothetical protein
MKCGLYIGERVCGGSKMEALAACVKVVPDGAAVNQYASIWSTTMVLQNMSG